MASLKKLDIINRRPVACIDEPKKLDKKPLTVNQHLKLLKEGKSGLDLPQLDFVLGPEKKDPGATILKSLRETKEKEAIDKLLKDKDVKTETFIPEEYENEFARYYNKLKGILKRVFNSIMSLKEKDIEQMYIHLVEIIDGLSKGGSLSDIFKREHIKSMGLMLVCISSIILLLKIIY